jgi:hypothetical protein
MTNTGTAGGATFDQVLCTLDNGVLAPEPSNCAPDLLGNTSNPTRAFANFEHGTVVTFFFISGGHNYTFTQGYYKNHESYTASVLSSNVGTTYVDGSGKLLIGPYALTAAQIDAILGTPVGKGYNTGDVVFTKDQLAMIHQLIAADLNITGGADGSSISATITAANNYSGASKSQFSAWTTALDNFNSGTTGPGHCS